MAANWYMISSLSLDFQGWFTESNSVSILVTGKTGVGKSSLINGIVGKEVAEEGETFDRGTVRVQSYSFQYHDVDITIWDSPGLQDGLDKEEEYIKDMQQQGCANCDLMFYCAKMNDTRFRKEDHDAIRKLTIGLGKDIWKHAIFVMTFANFVRARPERGRTFTPDEESKRTRDFFKERIKVWQAKLSKAVVEAVVDPNIVANIPIVPAGYEEQPKLPDRDNWLSSFWDVVVQRVKARSKSALCKANLHRIKLPKQITIKYPNKSIHEQSIQAEKPVVESKKIKTEVKKERDSTIFEKKQLMSTMKNEVKEKPLVVPVKTKVKEEAVTVTKDETTSAQPTAAWDLRGVEVCGEMTVVAHSDKPTQEQLIGDEDTEKPVLETQKIKMEVKKERDPAIFETKQLKTTMKKEVEEKPLALVPVKTEVKEEAVTVTKDETTSAQPTATWDLRGVEVCGEMTVVVYSSGAQQITWEGFGLKLHIDEGSLPAGIHQCTLTIKASLAGQYEFPDNSYLVSAIFWLRCEPMCKFTKQVTVEMRHCARTENNLKLKFVRAVCGQKQLPYNFEQLRGDFISHSSYGIIKVNLNHFSGLAITQAGSEDRSYLANVLYEVKHFSTCCIVDIYIVITWDVDSHHTVMINRFNDSHLETRHLIEFESDQVKLKVSNCSDEHWGVKVVNSSVVKKKDVDQFVPGKTSWIPYSHFKAKFSGDLSSLCDLECVVDIVGVRDRNKKFNIDITPEDVPGLMFAERPTERRQEDIEPIAQLNTSTGEVQKIVKFGQIKDSDQLFKDIAKCIYNKYIQVGTNLGLKYNVMENELETGRFSRQTGDIKAMEMLHQWKKSVHEHECTYSVLVAALEKEDFKNCAYEYCYTTVESYVLQSHYADISSAVNDNLVAFGSYLVECEFATQSTVTGIVSTLGDTNNKKATKLLEIVDSQFKTSTQGQSARAFFDKFVLIMANKLNRNEIAQSLVITYKSKVPA